MSFHIGQKVVCVDVYVDPKYRRCPLVKGRVYAIRVLRTCPGCGSVEVDVGIRSEGTTLCYCNHVSPSSMEWWFSPHRFRPYLPDLTRSLALAAQKESVEHPVIEIETV